MVTGAEGITGLVLVSALMMPALNSGILAGNSTSSYQGRAQPFVLPRASACALSIKHSKLPAVSSSPPNRIATMVSRHSGESCQTLAISFTWLCLAVKGGDKTRNAKLA